MIVNMDGGATDGTGDGTPDLAAGTDFVSRIAPTPSGFLHAGNAVNFLVTTRLVRRAGGQLRLRIDDMDALRYRSEFLDDIFWMLDWLDIDIDKGPSSAQEFLRNHSLQPKSEYYRDQLLASEALQEQTYACICSRADFAKQTGLLEHPNTCRRANHPLRTDASALRIRVPTDTIVDTGDRQVDLVSEMGDFVLWRRDGLPSYQLASVIEDRDAQVNLIVRGADLLPSSAAQLYLAPFLGADDFTRAVFVHHDLVTGSDGEKLSKSTLRAGPLRDRGDVALADLKGAIIAQADRISSEIALDAFETG